MTKSIAKFKIIVITLENKGVLHIISVTLDTTQQKKCLQYFIMVLTMTIILWSKELAKKCEGQCEC